MLPSIFGAPALIIVPTLAITYGDTPKPYIFYIIIASKPCIFRKINMITAIDILNLWWFIEGFFLKYFFFAKRCVFRSIESGFFFFYMLLMVIMNLNRLFKETLSFK
jgi:hypothetical protein